MFAKFEPSTFATDKSVAPRNAAITFTNNSGAEVPIETIVNPTTNAGIPILRAKDAEPETKNSEPLMSNKKPPKTIKMFVNIRAKLYHRDTMATTLFSTLTEKDKNEAVRRLIEESTPRDDFFLLSVLSVLMAVFGLLTNNVAVIIGSMLIAPLLSPILSISLGVVMADTRLIMRSLWTLLKSLAWTIPAAAIATLLFMSQAGLTEELNTEILTRTEPTVIAIAIAIVAGAAASFALIKPQLNATLPGVAIAVAIIPPLAVTGIGLARFDWAMATDSFILFLVNCISIIFASMVVFSLMNLYVKRPVAEKAIEKEDKVLAEEKRKAKQQAEEKTMKQKSEVLKKADAELKKIEE